MADAIRFEVINDLKFDEYFKLFRKIDILARQKVGIQLINNVANGSPKESSVPPILFGLLRGSGSVFLGSKFVYETPKVDGQGNPNKSHSEKDGVVTIGFDTAYAARMHETDWEPGPKSKHSGNVSNKFVEKHLRADKEELLRFYALLVKKGTGA
jgi:hypothetical protein